MSSVVGEKLKKARLQQSLSLEDVQSKIKIHPRILELMEEGRFDKLPSPIFAKNFLKSYATSLGLNASDLADELQKESPAIKTLQNDQPIFIRTAEEKDKKSSINKFSMEIAVPAVVVVVILIILYLCAKPVSVWLKDYSSKHLQSKKIQTTSRTLQPVKQTTTKKAVKVSSNEAPKALVATAASTAASRSGWLRSVDQQNFPNLADGVPLQLSVKASDNVWLRVTCDGKVLFQSVLKRGSVENWNAIDKIELWSGNPSNMSMALNGYKLGSPGKGSVKKMLISHRGVKSVS